MMYELREQETDVIRRALQVYYCFDEEHEEIRKRLIEELAPVPVLPPRTAKCPCGGRLSAMEFVLESGEVSLAPDDGAASWPGDPGEWHEYPGCGISSDMRGGDSTGVFLLCWECDTKYDVPDEWNYE